VEGFGATPKGLRTSGSENRKEEMGSGSGATRRSSKLVLLVHIRTTFCPEPYIDMRIEPGAESKWKITYEFLHSTDA